MDLDLTDTTIRSIDEKENDDMAATTLSLKQAAEQLGVSTSGVRVAIKRGTLAGALVEGQYQIDAKEVARYQSEHRRPAKPTEEVPAA